MAKQTQGRSKKSGKTSKAKAKKTGKAVSDKLLASARGGAAARPTVAAHKYK
jgi:hypothetical protein